ncbi:unnamed protein product, partial [Didymodactylos carnosus]
MEVDCVWISKQYINNSPTLQENRLVDASRLVYGSDSDSEDDSMSLDTKKILGIVED